MYDSEITLSPGYTAIPNVSKIQTTNTVVKTTKDVIDLLIRYGVPAHSIKRPALVKSLERLCGDYTLSRRKMVNIYSPRCTIFKGVAVQGPHRRWVLPPMRPHVLENLTQIFGRDNV